MSLDKVLLYTVTTKKKRERKVRRQTRRKGKEGRRTHSAWVCPVEK